MNEPLYLLLGVLGYLIYGVLMGYLIYTFFKNIR